MKHSILFGFLSILISSFSYGAIPQLINYQGLLLEENGTKVTGIKAITLKVFTGATDGNGTKEIYQENVGNVSVTDGLYAFNFGGTGLSVITTNETVGKGDGSTQIFNYTVDNAPVLDGTAAITKYASENNSTVIASWSQTDGSSDPNFISSVVNSTGAVSVTNASGAPTSGQVIRIVYDYNSVGIMGALASNPTAWLEVSVDGSPLLPRQRLVAVPFANVAGTIQGENLSVDPVTGVVKIKNGIQFGDAKPIKSATSSLLFPQGHDGGEIVNWYWNGSNGVANFYTVPQGKTLYIISSQDQIVMASSPTSTSISTNYRNYYQYGVGIYPSGSMIRTYNQNYTFTGILMDNTDFLTPIASFYTANYTVPTGKKLIITSTGQTNMQKLGDDGSTWRYFCNTYAVPAIVPSGSIIKSESHGWTGYLIDE
jgi:hypothetical protein